MNNLNKVLLHSSLRLIDHTNKTQFNNEPYTALHSFAIDDALALSVSTSDTLPVLRLWAHERTVVLGIPDARLPYIDEGIKYLKANNYDVIVRNSGGLAVALDEGVLNLSLIIPNAKQISIHEGYEAMFNLVKLMLHDLTKDIKAYEIVGSYCPGDYDLSIDGVKFAGISQRRVKDGAAIQIYIDISGNSEDRGKLVRDFYEIGLKNEQTKFEYPNVRPEKMNSLSNLLGIPLSVDQMKERINKTIHSLGKEIVYSALSDEELTFYESRFQQMIKRNEKII